MSKAEKPVYVQLMIQSILLVGIGGFFGSILRYLISYYLEFSRSSIFPFGTLAVNLIGSFLIGIIISAALSEDISPNGRIFLATGFCGGFTTFSSFSFEFFSLLQNGYIGYAFLYVFVSLVFGLLLAGLGFSLWRF